MSAGALPAASLELPGPFTLESGARLPSVTVAFRTSGRPDEDGGNAVLVRSALTGSAKRVTSRIVARFRRDIENDRGRREAPWVA